MQIKISVHAPCFTHPFSSFVKRTFKYSSTYLVIRFINPPYALLTVFTSGVHNWIHGRTQSGKSYIKEIYCLGGTCPFVNYLSLESQNLVLFKLSRQKLC